MKKRAVFLALALCMALVSTNALAAEGAVGYKLTFEYDSAMCSFTATDYFTNENIENGGTVYMNAEEGRAYVIFEITDIKEGYRIKDFLINGNSRADGMIDGAYGGMAITITEDSVLTVEIEKIPESLPAINSAIIYMDIQCSEQATSVTFTDGRLDRLFAQVSFDMEGEFPSYYTKCYWEYSTDNGGTWEEVPGWGSITQFYAAWPWYEEYYNMNFMTLQDYLLRLRVEPKTYYSTTNGNQYFYSEPISVNHTGNNGETSNPTPTPAPVEPSVPTVGGFNDVHEGDFYDSAVLWAVNNGITNGTSSTTFSPNASCSRAQIVTFLYRAMDGKAVTGSNPFTDVTGSGEIYDAILWALNMEITSGTTTTTFSPNDTCSRAQVVTFLWRALDRPEPKSTSNDFTDVPSDGDIGTAIQWAVDKGITSGTTKTTFSPNEACSRAQVVTFLYRALA